MSSNAADRRLFGRAVIRSGPGSSSSLCLSEGRSLPPITSAGRPVLPRPQEAQS
jgi:hypothetical protein